MHNPAAFPVAIINRFIMDLIEVFSKLNFISWLYISGVQYTLINRSSKLVKFYL